MIWSFYVDTNGSTIQAAREEVRQVTMTVEEKAVSNVDLRDDIECPLVPVQYHDCALAPQLPHQFPWPQKVPSAALQDIDT
jgi:hypothetical protein